MVIQKIEYYNEIREFRKVFEKMEKEKEMYILGYREH